LDRAQTSGTLFILVKRALLVLVLVGGVSQAAQVRGTVTLPPEARAVEARDGHWRVENGVLPIGPRVPDPRTEVVVALEGEEKPAAKEKEKDEDKKPTINVELHGLRADPRVIVAPIGTTVVFKNSDRLPHSLYIENARSLMEPEPTPAGRSREVRLFAPAEYQVRDEEFPHVECTIVVPASGRAVSVDEKGAFKMDVPEGKYTLKVFWRGAWVLTQPLEVGPRTTDIALTVPPPATHKGRD
jgi:hypothetical protein